MSQRTQWIILVILLCLLAVVAVITLRSKGSSGGAAAVSATSGAAASPAATGAPAGAAEAAAKPAGDSLDPDKLAPLNGWFNAKNKPAEMSPAVADTLGQPAKTEHAPARVSVATTPGEPGGPPMRIVSLPALQGLLCVNRVGMAVFDGDAYRSGEKIPGTGYKVTAVDMESVSVQGEDGKVITLKLSE